MREQKAKEYLRTIFALELEGTVRGAYIAREMNLTKATVSVALKALAEDGYLHMEKDHTVFLTETGRHLAREAIHQTVKNGRNYHALIEHLQQQEQGVELSEEQRQEQRLRWLEKERLSALLEAHWVLSQRYYCVRAVDLAHFLGQASATIRARLRRLEHGAYLRLGEDNVVELTEQGREDARLLHEHHAALRAEYEKQGLDPFEAAQKAAASC